MKASGVQSGKGLRLRNEGERLNLDLDTPQENDLVIDRDGTILLIVDKNVNAFIGDALIDVDTDAEEAHLVIRRKVPD